MRRNERIWRGIAKGTHLALLVFVVSCQNIRQKQGGDELETQRSTAREEVLLDHSFFLVSYNPTHMLPNWVKHKVLRERLTVRAKRRDKFFADPLLKQTDLPTVKPHTFPRGYDQGHMAPAGDFMWDQTANDETFVMTNMAPQLAGLNRQAWCRLESRIRKWACAEGELEIYTGPILTKSLERMHSGASIPERFFKVVLDTSPPRKAIGFMYSQTDKKDVYRERAVAVDAVEKETGFDFFKELGAEEEMIEASYSLSDWKEADCGSKRGRKSSQ